MAPVNPPAANSLSLGQVLDLIERWQKAEPGSAETEAALNAIDDFDVPAYRALAEQHAAQLRKQAERFEDSSVLQVTLDAAADFLCPPRREPEPE